MNIEEPTYCPHCPYYEKTIEFPICTYNRRVIHNPYICQAIQKENEGLK